MGKLVLCALALIATAFGAEVTGNWKGNAFRPDGTPSMDVLLMVKAEADKVTGTVGPSPEEQVAISNAKLSGDKLSFEVVTDNGVYTVTMTMAGDDMKGSAIRRLDGQDSPPMKVELKRTK